MKIIIENKAGTYKEFIDDSDDGTYKYPLKGVTYPVDYGYIEGYEGEDGSPLDVFVGTGDLYGSFVVWRYDVPLETKFAMNVTKEEWTKILEEFKPVIKLEKTMTYANKQAFEQAAEAFKKNFKGY